MRPWEILRTADPDIFNMIEQERIRQEHGLEFIASENIASQAVICAMANVFNNKYAEGLPAKRYYGGCEEVDKLENLCIERVTSLFGAKFANVQPHSGAQANAAALQAFLSPGDRILGMDLSHGGHLTHGSKVNFSGILYDSFFYKVHPKTEFIDYDQVAKTAQDVGPKLIIAGASAYPRQIDFAKFREIADSVGAVLMVDMAHIAGLVAAGLHPDPLPYADVVTSTTHKTLRGPRGGIILWNNADYTAKINKAVFPGTQGGPLEHIIAAKAVCFKEAASEGFKNYQKQVKANAQALATNLIANEFRLVSGGTDNHLLLIDLSKTEVSGKELEAALGSVLITVNKNTVPAETRSPFVTSGIRMGTPAVTTRGLKEDHMKMVADWVKRAYSARKDAEKLREIKEEVEALTKEFPLYVSW